ncbi:MAG: ABCB family ABC transporter ATP-binding protein/permease [Aestuariivirgaceae bacterium]
MSQSADPNAQANSHRREAGQFQTLLELMPYLWPDGRTDLKVRVVVAFLALIAAKVITVITPFAFKYAVDGLTASGAATAVAVVPLSMILAYGFGRMMMIIMTQIRDALFAKVGQNAVRQLAIRTFRHLHALSLSFHLERRTGGLSRIIERGTKGIDTILRFSLFNSFPTMIELFFVCAILWWNFGWNYALVTAFAVIAYTWFTYQATEWRIAIRRTMNDADTDANTKAIDSLLNFETVKYFGNEEHEAQRFDRSIARYEKAAVKTWTSLALLNSGQTILFTSGMVVCMVMAAYDVTKGVITVGDFVMVNAFLIQLYLPLNFLGTVYRDIKQGLIDIEAMFDLLKVAPGVHDRDNAQALQVRNGVIDFDDVSFAYDPERPIIKNLSFNVPAGHTVAIVGPSGAGKSTISRLLYRFYELTSGSIRIDGQDLSDVTQVSLRAAVGMVPQDTVLFNDTIRYNIRYGRPGASDAEVEAAAKLAQIHDFVMDTPDGYQTMVGERGLKLSGGEKQRVSIARTILKGPPILVLDEATSALDSMTEKDIQAALHKVSQDRTTVVIAHRLSTIIDADEIIVLEAGQIVERGRHRQLLSKKGVYATMWNRQREAEQARQKLVAHLDDRGLTAERAARLAAADSEPEVTLS